MHDRIGPAAVQGVPDADQHRRNGARPARGPSWTGGDQSPPLRGREAAMAVPPRSRPRRMLTVPGVYTPQHDTHLLMSAVARENITPGTRLLELGTGSGALAVHAARLGARVTAVDISHRAVLCARVNAALHRSRITVRYRDLSALDASRYDMVISNPRTFPRPPHGRRCGAGPARGTAARMAGPSSTGCVRPPRPCCDPAEHCSWSIRKCAASRPRSMSSHGHTSTRRSSAAGSSPSAPSCAPDCRGCAIRA